MTTLGDYLAKGEINTSSMFRSSGGMLYRIMGGTVDGSKLIFSLKDDQGNEYSRSVQHLITDQEIRSEI